MYVGRQLLPQYLYTVSEVIEYIFQHAKQKGKLNQTLDLSSFFKIKKRELKVKGVKWEAILRVGSVILCKLYTKAPRGERKRREKLKIEDQSIKRKTKGGGTAQ